MNKNIYTAPCNCDYIAYIWNWLDQSVLGNKNILEKDIIYLPHKKFAALAWFTYISKRLSFRYFTMFVEIKPSWIFPNLQ